MIKKIITFIKANQIIDIISLFIAVCALVISIIAYNNLIKTYRMQSDNYTPEIQITNTENQIKIKNKDKDLYSISRIKVIGTHSYKAMVTETEYGEEYVYFAISDYYHNLSNDNSNLDDIAIDTTLRYDDCYKKYKDSTIIPNYNHIIDSGLNKLNAKLDGFELRFEIAYYNIRTHKSGFIYYLYDKSDDGFGFTYPISEDELYNEGLNIFSLIDNVHSIEHSWGEVEFYVCEQIANNELQKSLKCE